MRRPMKWLCTAAALTAIVLLSSRCNRRPLVDAGNTHYVRVYLEEEIKNVTTGFYNPELAKPEYSTPEITAYIASTTLLRRSGSAISPAIKPSSPQLSI